MRIFPGGLPRARELLRTHFGHAALRVHQIKVLGSLLSGRSVLAVLPTGAGKSLCYQLPGLMAEGLTLVISPLVALMQDQVAALRRRGVRAAYVNSLLSADDRRAVLEAVCAGQVRLLYCAPERLEALVPRLRASGASRVSVRMQTFVFGTPIAPVSALTNGNISPNASVSAPIEFLAPRGR